jgi:hypothetical protein
MNQGTASSPLLLVVPSTVYGVTRTSRKSSEGLENTLSNKRVHQGIPIGRKLLRLRQIPPGMLISFVIALPFSRILPATAKLGWVISESCSFTRNEVMIHGAAFEC